MKNTITTATKVVYNTETNMLNYFSEEGRPLYGLGGPFASKKFMKACKEGLQVSITNINEKEIMEKKQLIRQLHAAMAAKGLLEVKTDIIASYGVKSSTELSLEQLRQLVDKINATDTRPTLRQSRSKVLLLLSKLGITGSKEEGWERVNGYLSSPKIAGKALYEMSVSELDAAAVKLRSIFNKQTK